jgi:hypothetical protein
VGFVVDEVALGQVFLKVLWFSSVIIFPVLLHLIHVSSGGWKAGLLEAQFHRDMISPHCKKKEKHFTQRSCLTASWTEIPALCLELDACLHEPFL